VTSGTYTSGDHSQIDNNALSASNFAVSGGASATFSAGNCIQLNPGFHASAIGATVPTTFHAWVDIAPTAVSVVPSSPPQNPPLSQSFTWTVSSPAGHSNLSHVFALFSGTSTSTTNACYVHYDASSNLVYLADNTSTTWLGGFAPSSSGSIGNSQCTIYGTASSPNPTSSGTQLGLSLTVAFQSSFAGTKNEYLYALDSSGVYTGWQQMGTWTVPAPPAPDFALTAATDSYYAQTGSSTPAYTLTVTPQNGFNSPVSFSVAWNMYGCLNPNFNPGLVTGSGTTTVTMSCYETLQNTYWTTVTASGGGKSHQLNLYLYVGQGQQYYLTTGVSPGGSGNISLASGWYSPGTVPFTVTANAGFAFQSFSGNCAVTGTQPNFSINLTGSCSITANFVQTQTQYQITTSVSPAGYGSMSLSTGYYNAGAVPFTVTANGGYAFQSFSGNCAVTGTLPNFSIGLTGACSITANFVLGDVISGQVTLSGTITGVSGVNISASGSQTASTTTDAYGRYSLPALAAGGNYTIAAAKSGYILSAAQTFTSLASNQTANFTAAPTLSINGGGSTAEVAPGANVSLAFNLYDQSGATDIGWAQFYLADSSGAAHCYGDWGRPSALDLYDGDTGATSGFGITQSDSFCTVSLASITNSPTDPTEVTVVLNFTFNPGTDGTYSVLTQLNYGPGTAGPWQALGTLTIDPARESETGTPVDQPPPDLEPIPTPPTPISASVTNCNDISNTWTIPNTIVSMTLNQAGSSVTGTGVGTSTYYRCDQYGNCVVTGTCASGVNYTISGNSTGAGAFSLDVTSSATDNCGVAGQSDQGTFSATISSCSSTGGMTLSTTSGVTTTPTTSEMRPRLAQATTMWTGKSNPPGITATLDLMAGKITTQLTGQKTADLTVNLNNSQGVMMLSTPHSSAQGGNSFSDSFRTLIQAGQQYGTVTANWDNTKPCDQTNSSCVSVPVTFFTVGYTRFTQYNTPISSDKSCSGATQPAIIICGIDKDCGGNPSPGYCYYKSAMLGANFIARAGPNREGTGLWDVNGNTTVLKTYGAYGDDKTQPCPLLSAAEGGLDAAHTFYSVDTGGKPITKIDGAHSRFLSDATNNPNPFNKNNPPPGSVATDVCATNTPSPIWKCNPVTSPPVYIWSDALLLFDPGDINDAKCRSWNNNDDTKCLRSVVDLCPACKYRATEQTTCSHQAPQQNDGCAHIDMYNGTDRSCSINTDYGYYYAFRLR
jgi:hypothetical protein